MKKKKGFKKRIAHKDNLRCDCQNLIINTQEKSKKLSMKKFDHFQLLAILQWACHMEFQVLIPE